MQGLAGNMHSTAAYPRSCRLAASRPSRRSACRVQALFGGGDNKGGSNPFANMANMGNLMEQVKQAQVKVQSETARVQKELSEMEFEGYSEDELVRVVMNGNQVPVSVDITDEGMALGAEKLAEAVTAAMKEAYTASQTGMKEKMRELASSLGLPPNMPGA